ncbi:hypothetical protein GUJ93_ZPchr0006g41842 [Zizania palustris]|uniref:Uncharacterized protein n=1 Tax=Zizania palustris TaxID=103762 RepID=A0A8J5TCX6_ZIZPA|nr:hypothetical protein GUJ93_ZPchr0006g41842 [Zizania palustris]
MPHGPVPYLPPASAATHAGGLLRDPCRWPHPLICDPPRRAPPRLLPTGLRRSTVASFHVAEGSAAPPHAGHRFFTAA